MRIHRDQLVIRIGGSLLGFGFLGLGAFALAAAPADLPAADADRVFWFGVTLVIAGVLALAVSWLVHRLDNIWCAPPRRGWWR